jgi:integrase
MHVSPHMRPLVMFMLYTGARVGETLWLEWRCIDLNRAHVQFEKTKMELREVFLFIETSL